ncbi:MAG: orotidine-5'-phosphate decarboxylase [Ignavibacteria bacterium]|nr:orotidine-5'-phosphate decarboxylase [Ignavibacteria bacterium]
MIYKKKLEKVIKSSKSNLVVGLDTDINKIPLCFLKYKNPILAFNKKIIDSTVENCAGYKLNLAFYEAAGVRGLEALEETVKYIQADRMKICDAKRGDIGNTAELYAVAYFDKLDFDAITLSPYMGYDSISPFLKRKNKLAYILIRTSNPGADDFQKLKSGKKFLYEIIAEKSLKWSKEQIGFVVGANHTKEIRKYTSKNENIPLLIPGIGAQGNDLKNLLNSVGNNSFLINASRSVIYAGDRMDKENIFFKKVQQTGFFLNKSIEEIA